MTVATCPAQNEARETLLLCLHQFNVATDLNSRGYYAADFADIPKNEWINHIHNEGLDTNVSFYDIETLIDTGDASDLGLSFEYHQGSADSQGFFYYHVTTGGPNIFFKIAVNPNMRAYRVEYCYHTQGCDYTKVIDRTNASRGLFEVIGDALEHAAVDLYCC